MKKIVFGVLFSFFFHSAFSQFGLSTPMYTGKDAKVMSVNWMAQVQVFYPVFVPLNLKDSVKITLLLQPAIKFDWYNFKKNLIVDRQNNYTSFTEDIDVNHIYKNRFLKTTSMMQTYSVYMPVNVLLKTKKLEHFVFAPGFYVNYLLGGEFKRKYTDNGVSLTENNKFKDNADFYGFQRFQYGFCGHVSYKYITVYGIYSLTPLFKKSQSIDVRRFEVGIWLNLFWKRKHLRPY